MTSFIEPRRCSRLIELLRLICVWVLIPALTLAGVAAPVAGASADATAASVATPEPATAASNVAVASNPVSSMAFDNADVRSIFTILTDLAGLNLIFDPSLQGKLTINIRAVTVTEAIQIVAKAAQVTATIADGLLIVSARDQQTTSPASVEDTQVRVYSLEYADPTKVAEIAAAVTPNLKVMGEATAKRIVARGTPAELTQFESFLQQFDKAGQQVFIEARVQEVSRQALKELGISWSLPDFSALIDAEKSVLTIGIKGLAAALDAMESTGDARLLAQPQITTISGETATIFVGDRVPVLLKGSETESDTVQYIEAGISLEIIPRIGTSGKITVHVKPQVSNIATWVDQPGGGKLPQVRTRTAETTVQVQDGQPIVIGGLIRQEDRDNMSRVSGLASLPIVGALFRSNRSDSDQIETIIILTPHIVKDDQDASAVNGLTNRFRLTSENQLASDIKQKRAQTSIYPSLLLTIDPVADLGLGSLSLGLRWSLPTRRPLHVETSVAAPLSGGKTILRYGLGGRVDVDQLILQLTGYGLVDAKAPLADPQWELEALAGYSLWEYRNWFFEPGIKQTWHIAAKNVTNSSAFSMKLGFQF